MDNQYKIAVLAVCILVVVCMAVARWLHLRFRDDNSDMMYAARLYDELARQPVETSDYTLPSEVVPGLFIGGIRAASEESLAKYHITAVVNMASQLTLDSGTPRNIAIHRMDVPALDVPFYEMDQHFDDTFKFIHEHIAAGGRVLVHCYAGVSRSATIVALYLQRAHGWDTRTALAHVKSRRSVILPNVGFISDLITDHKRRAKCGAKV